MSQAKVDKYKKDKQNRKKNMRKDKVKREMRHVAAAVICLALVGWLGYSVYHVYDSNKAQETAEIDYSAITDYQQTLLDSE